MLTSRNRAVTPHLLRGPGFQSQAFIRGSWIPEQVRDDNPFLSLRTLDRPCILVSELSDFYSNDESGARVRPVLTESNWDSQIV